MQIKEEQSHWYSPIVGCWKVLIAAGGIITGRRIVHGAFDPEDSVQVLPGSVGISDGIPDLLQERILAIESGRRNLLARQEVSGCIERELDAATCLDRRLAHNLSDVSKISSFWSVLEGKIQAAITNLRRSTEAATTTVRDLHLLAARDGITQLSDLARQMDI